MRLIFLSLLFLISCSFKEEAEKTTNNDKSRIEEYLGAHLVRVVPEGQRVKFETDGEIGIGARDQSWSSNFSLSLGEAFKSQPDHHSSSTFQVKEIGATGIVLRYQTTFDHSSFGKNLLTKDEGDVEIVYHR